METRKSVIGGYEIARKFVGTQEIKAEYCGDVLFWEKNSGKEILGKWKFRYKDYIRFTCDSGYVCDVDFGDGAKQEKAKYFEHEAPGIHICTVTLVEDDWKYPNDPTRGPLVVFLKNDDKPGGIIEPITDIPKIIDQDGGNRESLLSAFFYCNFLLRVQDTIFKNLVSSTRLAQTFIGCEALKSISEKVYSYLKVDPIDCHNHYNGCIQLSDAPKLYEMFPNAIGKSCYDGCIKLPYYSDIPFPWRTDLSAEDVITMVFPPEDEYSYPADNSTITITVYVKAESFRFADNATLWIIYGANAKTTNIKGFANGTFSQTFKIDGNGKREVKVSIEADIEYDILYTPDNMDVGIGWEINII